MKKIFVLSVGRSDYDRYYPIINELNKYKKDTKIDPVEDKEKNTDK